MRMAEKKQCVRCNRTIDAVARICPFCNWDQARKYVPPPPQPAAEPAYVPPAPERDLRKYMRYAIGGVVMVIVAFSLGLLIHGKNPPKTPAEEAAEQTTTAPVKPAPHADVRLVPVNESGGIPQPITSAPPTAPAQGVPTEYQRSDATAVSSAEYAQLAARAQAERKAAKQIVDPRTLTGPAYEQGARPEPRPQISSSQDREERNVTRTQPVPEYQPVPDIAVGEPATVRLLLTIGPDGRVHEVDVIQGMAGETPKIIHTVQQWRFKPATENGMPVSAPFRVDLSFRGTQ